MSIEIPQAQAMFDESERLAKIVASQKLPSIIKRIEKAVKKQLTYVVISMSSKLVSDILVSIFSDYGYDAQSIAGELHIDWDRSE